MGAACRVGDAHSSGTSDTILSSVPPLLCFPFSCFVRDFFSFVNVVLILFVPFATILAEQKLPSLLSRDCFGLG